MAIQSFMRTQLPCPLSQDLIFKTPIKFQVAFESQKNLHTMNKLEITVMSLNAR